MKLFHIHNKKVTCPNLNICWTLKCETDVVSFSCKLVHGITVLQKPVCRFLTISDIHVQYVYTRVYTYKSDFTDMQSVWLHKAPHVNFWIRASHFHFALDPTYYIAGHTHRHTYTHTYVYMCVFILNTTNKSNMCWVWCIYIFMLNMCEFNRKYVLCNKNFLEVLFLVRQLG